jgi:hypothetical protein
MLVKQSPSLAWAGPQPSRAGIGLRAQKIALRCLLVTLFAWFTTVTLHELDLGGSWDHVSFRTWALLFAWVAGFAVAFWLTLAHFRIRPVAIVTAPPASWWNAWVVALTLAAMFGATLVVYDFAWLRGYGFGTAAAAIRVEETQAVLQGVSRSSAVSGVGRLLIPAILVALILAVCRWRELTMVTRLVLAGGLVLLIAEQILFEGGRFFIIMSAAITIFSYFVCPPVGGAPGRRLRKRIPYIRLAVLGVVLMSFVSYVFVERILNAGDFFWSAYLHFASNFAIDVNYETVDRFDGPLGPLWFSICLMWLYVTQGINELDTLLQLQYFNHAYGLYQVPHVGQFALVMLGVDIRYDLVANLPTVGTYATFYGSNFIDFGNVGAILSGILLAVATARGVLGFALGRVDTLSLLGPIFFILCLFSPIISLVTNLWPAMAWVVVVGITARKWQRPVA